MKTIRLIVMVCKLDRFWWTLLYHPDSYTKSVSVIVYFDPDQNNTTTLWGKPGVNLHVLDLNGKGIGRCILP